MGGADRATDGGGRGFPPQQASHYARLYRGIPQTPETAQSIRSVDMCPTVRWMLQGRKTREGLVFSADGVRPIGAGNWTKRQWRDAQLRAGIRTPITWHDLRHQFVSLLIAAGKHPKYVAVQAGHSSAGFTLDRYGSLFETLPITSVEWWNDLLWPREHRPGTIIPEENQREGEQQCLRGSRRGLFVRVHRVTADWTMPSCQLI